MLSDIYLRSSMWVAKTVTQYMATDFFGDPSQLRNPLFIGGKNGSLFPIFKVNFLGYRFGLSKTR